LIKRPKKQYITSKKKVSQVGRIFSKKNRGEIYLLATGKKADQKSENEAEKRAVKLVLNGREGRSRKCFRRIHSTE
jgi:hypothetical protein